MSTATRRGNQRGQKRSPRPARLFEERVLSGYEWPPLKIDVDGRRPLPMDEVMERMHRANRRIRYMVQRRSPSGRGWHLLVWVYPPQESATETVALQLLLGSDPYRESYNLNRARAVDAGMVPEFWRERWNVLYGPAT